MMSSVKHSTDGDCTVHIVIHWVVFLDGTTVNIGRLTVLVIVEADKVWLMQKEV